MPVLVYDGTVKFCNRLIDPGPRILDLMVQAARQEARRTNHPWFHCAAGEIA